MAEREWFRTDEALPPQGLVVEAMDSGGHVQDLLLDKRLWWFPDHSMYVYFTPRCWRTKAARNGGDTQP